MLAKSKNGKNSEFAFARWQKVLNGARHLREGCAVGVRPHILFLMVSFECFAYIYR